MFNIDEKIKKYFVIGFLFVVIGIPIILFLYNSLSTGLIHLFGGETKTEKISRLKVNNEVLKRANLANKEAVAKIKYIKEVELNVTESYRNKEEKVDRVINNINTTTKPLITKLDNRTRNVVRKILTKNKIEKPRVKTISKIKKKKVIKIDKKRYILTGAANISKIYQAFDYVNNIK